MSNLIVYCRSVAFNVEKIRKNGFIFNEMSSFPETKAEKLICQGENKLFLKYHQVCNALLFFVVCLYFVLRDGTLHVALLINALKDCCFQWQ